MTMTWPQNLEIDAFRGLMRLRQSSIRGRKIADDLEESGIWRRLASFDAVVAGTIPLGIDHPASDIDILCHVPDPAAFIGFCQQAFAEFKPDGRLRPATENVGPAAVVRFDLDVGTDVEHVEIFATNKPVIEQFGFRNMVVEARLLAVAGDALIREIKDRKQVGEKTEPAFAAVLGLSGDPYLALNKLFSLGPDDVAALCCKYNIE
jgi:hypothetical protein